MLSSPILSVYWSTQSCDSGCKRVMEKEYIYFGTVSSHLYLRKLVKGNYSKFLLKVRLQQELELFAVGWSTADGSD